MTTLQVFQFHFERMWKERHTSTSLTIRESIRQNLKGQRDTRNYEDVVARVSHSQTLGNGYDENGKD